MFRKGSFPEEQRCIDAIRSISRDSLFLFSFSYCCCCWFFFVLCDEVIETCQNACFNFSMSDGLV
jgi:hypothetical protein